MIVSCMNEMSAMMLYSSTGKLLPFIVKIESNGAKPPLDELYLDVVNKAGLALVTWCS
jgi:hypothetical protein